MSWISLLFSRPAADRSMARVSIANMHYQRIVYLLLAVTGVGAPLLFVVAFWITRALGFDIPILYLALGALLLTVFADVLIAIANEQINMRADAKASQLNEPVGEQAVVLDAFKSSGGASTGRVRVHGQVWSAHCNEGTLLDAGQVVEVTDRRGLTIIVASDTENEVTASSVTEKNLASPNLNGRVADGADRIR